MREKRNRNIELLRIASMFLIVIGHTASTLGGITTSIQISDFNIDLRQNTWDIQQLMCTALAYLGNLGNAVFIVISSWFLLESSKTRLVKVITLILDTFFISVGSVLIYILLGYGLTGNELLRMAFPITFENNWFITCYILIYAIHPMLNTAIRSLSQKQLASSCLVMVFLYCGINFVLWGRFYYNGLIGFIVIYFLTAYVKFFVQKHSCELIWNIRCLVFGIAGFLLLLLTTNILGFAVQGFQNKMMHWTNFCNPFFVCIALSLFNIARCKKSVSGSTCIDTVGAVTMLIYLIHENYIVRTYVRPMLFSFIYDVFSYRYILVWVMVVAGGLFLASACVGILYRKIFRGGVLFLSDKLEKIICALHNWIIDHIMEIE